MTLLEIQEALHNISACAGDDELAHIEDDKLMLAFIKYVSTYEADPELAEKAKLVLTSAEIKFSRWYA